MNLLFKKYIIMFESDIELITLFIIGSVFHDDKNNYQCKYWNDVKIFFK